MKATLLRLRDELGALGLGALALLALAALFHAWVLGPLQAREAELQERLARQAPRAAAEPHDAAADKLGALYEFLRKEEQVTDWLARLHAIGAATGVQLRSASYSPQPAEGRILRYEIVLPVAGSYPQIRAFLSRSLAEIPVMSIDQLKLRRENRNQSALQAELRLTLHMVKS